MRWLQLLLAQGVVSALQLRMDNSPTSPDLSQRKSSKAEEDARNSGNSENNSSEEEDPDLMEALALSMSLVGMSSSPDNSPAVNFDALELRNKKINDSVRISYQVFGKIFHKFHAKFFRFHQNLGMIFYFRNFVVFLLLSINDF